MAFRLMNWMNWIFWLGTLALILIAAKTDTAKKSPSELPAAEFELLYGMAISEAQAIRCSSDPRVGASKRNCARQ